MSAWLIAGEINTKVPAAALSRPMSPEVLYGLLRVINATSLTELLNVQPDQFFTALVRSIHDGDLEEKPYITTEQSFGVKRLQAAADPTKPNATNPTQQDPDPNYWVQSGRLIFDAAHFYLPKEAVDPFEKHHYVAYDAYYLLTVSSTDPLGNVVQATNDYQVLTPYLVTDPNLNRHQVVFDALGRVTALAVAGKDVTTNPEGDSVAHPTVSFEYHLDVIPAYVKTTAREQHYYPSQTDGVVQESYTYSDGFGRIVQQKVQAEAGPVPGVTGTVTDRWVGTGRTVYNNKGNPVKQFEPFFSQTSDYESEASIVEWGVTPIIYYDPLDRVIRTDLPNGTFSKVVFDAWQQENWDPNDTAHDPDDATKDSAWYTARINGGLGPEEQRAAQLAAKHAKTPTTTYLDSLGRVFLSRADNGPDPGTPTGPHRYYYTKTTLDIEGNQLAIMDARQIARIDGIHKNTIEQQFDVIGRRYQVDSADAGKRLTLLDVAGKPMFTWDNRAQRLAHDYDELQRPTHTRLRVGATETVVGRSVYGESLDSGAQNLNPNALSAAQTLNLRGQAYLGFDSAGLARNDHFDFKGNLLSATRHIATTYLTTPDWSSLPELSPTVPPADVEAYAVAHLLADTSTVQMRFTTQSAFDALNRVTSHTTPDGSVTTPGYNRANLLETVTVQQGTTVTHVITNIDYNEKGQRILCAHGERVSGAANDPAYTISYSYDPKTFRVTHIWTIRASDSVKLQDLSYTYDPVGNIVELDDATPKTVIFDSSTVDTNGLYEYDPLYRLTQAKGREHPGQQINDADPAITWTTIPHVNDSTGITRYTEQYEYDEVGNITNFHHVPDSGTGWTRIYTYEADNNRLDTASEPVGAVTNPYPYTYNDHGSMTSMAHLAGIDWDYAERMQHANQRGGGDVYFVYDGTGERVRKVWVHNGTIDERIYLGGYEIYRRTSGTTLAIHRQTLHVMDDKRRVAMFENTLTDNTDPQLLGIRKRFQLDNHLGSSMMEVDAQGTIITYEEYHPYGTTALNLKNDSAHFSTKRYRYTGKERDEETSLYYHGARYYAPWLGRWTAADPLGIAQPGVPDPNLYAYARGAAVNASDPSGMQETSPINEPVPIGTDAGGGTLMSDGTVAPASVSPSESEGPPAPQLHPDNYRVSSAGTRWRADAPRDRYDTVQAQDEAAHGRYKLAEIANNPGLGCLYCHTVKAYSTRDEAEAAIDLEHMNRMILGMRIARDVTEFAVTIGMMRALGSGPKLKGGPLPESKPPVTGTPKPASPVEPAPVAPKAPSPTAAPKVAPTPASASRAPAAVPSPASGNPAWLKPEWGRNRLVKELHARGFKLRKPTREGGGLIYENVEGAQIRIMPKPPGAPTRSAPSVKWENDYYFRYKPANSPSGPGRWGPHTTIPNKTRRP